MKHIKKIVVAVICVIVILVVGVVLWIDSVAKAGVEVGATYALGVSTTLDGMDVGMFSGSVDMSELNVNNPEGFDTPHFLRLGDGRVAVSLGTLMEDKVVIPELIFSGLSMNLESKGTKANYKVIMDNLKKLESGEKAPAEDEGEGKGFVVNKVSITDVEVQVDLLPIGGKLTRVPVKIDKIEINNVGSDSDKGVLLAELTGILIKAILTSIVNQAGDLLPGDIADQLNHGLAQLEELGNVSVQVVGEVTAQAAEVAAEVAEKAGEAAEELGKAAEGAAKEAGEAADKAAKDLGKAADDAGKKVTEGLGGLLGGKKDKDKKKD
jgi:hypothetical protein